MAADEQLELIRELRGQARFCRSMAANSALPGAADGFLDLAAHFEERADQLERHAKRVQQYPWHKLASEL